MLQTGMRAPMGIKIKGGDLKQLESFSQELEAVVKQVDGVKKEAVFADRLIGKPYLIIDIDREKLIRYGLGLSEVQDVIQIAVGGKILGQSVDGRSRIDLKLRYPKALRETPEDIGNIYVKSGSKQNIKLRDVADIRYERGPQMIKSEDGFIVSYLLFDKELDQAELELVDAVSKRIQMEIESGKLIVPAGLSFEFSGNYQNQIRAEKSLKLLIPLALIIIFMILYLQFKSISTSLMVFSGILVAFSGGFILLGLYAQDWFLNINFFGTDVRDVLNIKTINLSVAVWVGFIALFGIASDDGVLMATYLDQSFAMNQPKTKSEVRQAVIHAGLKRIRPCLMTSATTLLALVPVMMSSGRGSDLMIPMAIPSFGGMLFALITLFVVPVLYSLNQELKLKKYEI